MIKDGTVQCLKCKESVFVLQGDALEHARRKQLFTASCLKCGSVVHVFPDGTITSEDSGGLLRSKLGGGK